MMKMYDYFVYFTYNAEGYLTQCCGNIVISRKKKIKTFMDIHEISNWIEKQIGGSTNVVIANFILLGRNRH